jgi:uncharacterized protein
LVVLNYTIDPAILTPLLPAGTEIDYFEGNALMSVIAFHFVHNKLFGVVPTYPAYNFEELNLRFYVRRVVNNEVRRGVVFVKEVVPSALVAGTARLLYNEPYEARPMRHDFTKFSEGAGGTLSYGATIGTSELTVSATTSGDLKLLAPHSIEEFILEHYWGYTQQPDGSTSEYRVSHEPWCFWSTSATSITGNIAALYPQSFKPFLEEPPHSSFVARGSPVSVFAYRRFHPSCDVTAFPRTDVHGYVLYDGSCGFCAWWVPRCERALAHAGFAIAPLQDPWVSRSVPLSRENLLNDIRIALTNGTLLTGADAYLYAMRRMRWLKLLGAIFSLPGLRALVWWAYRLFNRNRFTISRVCGLNRQAP